LIVLFTDFGLQGPYVGQLQAVLWGVAPAVPVVNLFADAPMQRPQEAAYLLAAYATGFASDSVFLCVVDPGVGSDRPPVAARLDGRWFVGPGNGLFEPLRRRATVAEEFRILRVPADASASFHGRDVFAPVAGRLAAGQAAEQAGLAAAPLPRFTDWPDDLARVIYIDHYGNAMTGLRASRLAPSSQVEVGGRRLRRARTFSDVPPGEAFWYENANGLVEVAVNQGRAAAALALDIGAPVKVVD
jgi:S-adenosyl-L-methionine hydrolase (adenosine-forming)